MIIKIAYIILIIILGLIYFFTRLFSNLILGNYARFKRKFADPTEKKFQATLFFPFIMASLSIMIISIMKLFAWISFSFWWVLLPVFIDIFISILVAFLYRRIWERKNVKDR